MKAIVYEKPNCVKMVEIPIPKPENDEVLVKVLRVGVCGTDQNMLRGTHVTKLEEGALLGHEIVGIRIDTGEKVVVNPLIYCGLCRPCRMGNVNLCEKGGFLGDGQNVGGFAEYVCVKNDRLINVDSLGIPDNKLVLTEPMAVGIHASQSANITEGPVAVIGAGIIGMATLIALKRRGVRDITVTDIDSARWEAAKLAGATETAAELTKKDYEVIYDCVGTNQTRATMLDYLIPGGTLVSVGAMGTEFHFRSTPVARFGKSLTGSFAYTDANLHDALIHTADLTDLSWVKTVDLDKGEEALNDLLNKRIDSSILKLVFKVQ